MRVVLICHRGAVLDEEGLAAWLASAFQLAGIVIISEKVGRKWQRIRRELRRGGLLGFVDVMAFRAWHALLDGRADRRWEQAQLETLRRRFPPLAPAPPILHVRSPNTPETIEFVRRVQPDLMIARCKTLLKEELFSVPRHGTFVMHPGICPEYRNAHGCFWARVSGEPELAGMTLLRIDRGVDTGPIHGYFYPATRNELESHIVTQHRVVLDNLDAIRDRLLAVCAGDSRPIDTTDRRSAAWGQPRLSSYLRWRLRRGQVAA